MTEELKKQGIADDAAVAETVEETVAAPGLDEAAKAAEREARRQALYEENERAEDERARAEAERMRDVDDEDEDETKVSLACVVDAQNMRLPATPGRRCAACGARPPATIGASISCSRASCSMSSLTPRRRLTAPA